MRNNSGKARHYAGIPTALPYAAPRNEPRRAGQWATGRIIFGPEGRYCAHPRHTAGDAVEWLLFDSEDQTVHDGQVYARNIAQAPSYEALIAWLLKSLAEREKSV